MKRLLCLRLTSLFIFLISVPSLWAFSETPSVQPARIQERINTLASVEFGGRFTGSKGNELAARYIADAFRSARLMPVGTSRQFDANAKLDGSGYYQPFRFNAGVAEGKNNSLQAVVDGKKRGYRKGTEFVPSSVSSNGEATGDVVFVGYGIETPDRSRNDYAGIDARGKVVLAMAGAPSVAAGGQAAMVSSVRRKAMIAKQQGAKGLIVMLPVKSDVPHVYSDTVTSDAGLPIVVVRRSLAESWFKAVGKSLADVEKSTNAGEQSFSLPIRVELTTDIRKVEKTTSNIVGLIEGNDPVLKNEIIVIGAHMDHLGMGSVGSLSNSPVPAMHPGADDNASGSAGVMEIADYFSSKANRPKRSLLFICFTGEELGLYGSNWYVKHPIVPLERTVAMLNMDMIGRMQDDKLIIVGGGTSTKWAPLLADLNKTAYFNLQSDDAEFGGSDHQPFYMNHVPVLFFFTGIHPDYHRPSDTADKINSLDEGRVVEFVAACADEIGNENDKPDYRALPTQGSSGGPSRFRVSLGTVPEYGANVEGVQLGGVRENSPASKAGMKAGDIIIKFGGIAVKGIQDFMEALTSHKAGDVVEIVVKRGNETLTLKATLEAPRSERQ